MVCALAWGVGRSCSRAPAYGTICARLTAFELLIMILGPSTPAASAPSTNPVRTGRTRSWNGVLSLLLLLLVAGGLGSCTLGHGTDIPSAGEGIIDGETAADTGHGDGDSTGDIGIDTGGDQPAGAGGAPPGTGGSGTGGCLDSVDPQELGGLGGQGCEDTP